MKMENETKGIIFKNIIGMPFKGGVLCYNDY